MTETTRKARRIKVLVVDDDRATVRLIRMVLLNAGFDVVTAFDGIEALSAVAVEGPDVITLDLDMPNLDGRGFRRELELRRAEIPVVIVSGRGAFEARRELGAAAALAKPFDPDVLVAVVGEAASAG